jgi:predicted RNA binding protein with dsRBD fold (UPF0201 family)
MSVVITAESLVNPTEDELKVERALHNIFPSAQIARTKLADDVIRLEVSGNSLQFLKTLRNLIRQERIRSAARSILMGGTRGDRLQLYLNKQAAYVSRVSFCEPVGESPLGPISIQIETADPYTVIDFLASKPAQSYR